MYRRRQFLLAHPFCQVWLAEHGIVEKDAISSSGRIQLGNKTAIAPLATEIHHKNKRRGSDILDQTHWLAVSSAAHERIESDKKWARERGFLLPF